MSSGFSPSIEPINSIFFSINQLAHSVLNPVISSVNYATQVAKKCSPKTV